MKREIKFRGKKVKHSEWIYINDWAYGSLLISEIDVNELSVRAEIHERLLDDFSILKHEVYHKSVGQFTGLRDKNGKEIYEGDIVEICDEDDEGVTRVSVAYDRGCFCNLFGYLKDEVIQDHIEVVGTIYETPELGNKLTAPLVDPLLFAFKNESGNAVKMCYKTGEVCIHSCHGLCKNS
jgi:uncharacterized phage protein (TIGR01671 family)